MCNHDRELTAEQMIRLEAVKLAWVSWAEGTPDVLIAASQKVADFVHGPDWRPVEYQKVDAALKRLVVLHAGVPVGESWTAKREQELCEIEDLLREVVCWQEPPF